MYQLQVAGEYADDGVTGTLLLGERPEGQRLLQDAEAGRFGTVLVYRITRLGRSLHVILDAHEQLSARGVTFRPANEPFDTSTPAGNFFFQLLGSMAELDRKQTLEQLARGRDRAVHEGKWTDGPIPYGYILDATHALVPSTRLVEALQMTEAEVVQDLFQRLATGSSGVHEARRLTALDVPTTRYYSHGGSRTGSKWYPNSVINLITSPIYKGLHVFASRYGAIERAVPALVDVDLWDRANAQIQRNKHLPKANATRLYLLRGLITCDHCESAYVGQTVTNRNGSPSAFYRCCGRNPHWYARQERCTGKVVQVAWIESQ
jgi:site-specific DNA recombinase